jgi:hypothetical protein
MFHALKPSPRASDINFLCVFLDKGDVKQFSFRTMSFGFSVGDFLAEINKQNLNFC